MMENERSLLEQIATCVARGKVNAEAKIPPDMAGQPGAVELVRQALDLGVEPMVVINEGLSTGMRRVGDLFSQHKAFIPDMLLASRAFTAALEVIKERFSFGESEARGVFIIGTVLGDLHDIGKNLVAHIVAGAGYHVIDLGVNVSPERFVEEAKKHEHCAVGLSTLLTTTMPNMEKTVKILREQCPGVPVIVGGAPVTDGFASRIGADAHGQDPRDAVRWLDETLLPA
ncbi:MAG TPA: corrinoid protein [Candidatus Hydrogenedentes bacterium]|nr:corrinoid protein [Candidatus Hydrogenedentota bacterium]